MVSTISTYAVMNTPIYAQSYLLNKNTLLSTSEHSHICIISQKKTIILRWGIWTSGLKILLKTKKNVLLWFMAQLLLFNVLKAILIPLQKIFHIEQKHSIELADSITRHVLQIYRDSNSCSFYYQVKIVEW